MRPAVLALFALLPACKALDTLDRIVADPSQAISLHADTTVTEAARSLQCNAPDAVSRVTLLKDLAAVRDVQARRGLRFSNEISLKAGAYALVDMGRRTGGGYGLAITRTAVLHEDGHLYLHSTFIEPAQGTATGTDSSSPCALVKLPEAKVLYVRVYDQTDRLRADSAQPNGVSEFLRWPF